MTDMVVEPRTLTALQLMLRSLVADTEATHEGVVRETDRVLTRIRAAVTMRQSVVERCRRSLDSCLRSDRESCAAERAALEVAIRRLDAARRALAMATQATADHQATARSIRKKMFTTQGQGLAFLSKKLDKVAAATGAGGSTTSLGAIALGAAARLPGGGATSAVEAPAGLPAGCTLVPLDLIDQNEVPIAGPQDFEKGYSIEDLAYAWDLLDQRVLPALAAGDEPGSFADLDLAAGVMGTRSLADTYSGFLDTRSGNVIKLEQRPDGTYSIVNGRHRIYVAGLTGRTVVPAFVLGTNP